jgi:hypothetical protein
MIILSCICLRSVRVAVERLTSFSLHASVYNSLRSYLPCLKQEENLFVYRTIIFSANINVTKWKGDNKFNKIALRSSP